MKTTILLLLGSMALGLLPAQSLTDSLEKELQALYEESSLPGFGVAILSKDQVLYQQGFGWADLDAQRPYSVNTIQYLGSISKPVIGMALMFAVEEGLLRLDQPIHELLPFELVHPYFPDQPITIRHLATHTSGMVDSRNTDAPICRMIARN